MRSMGGFMNGNGMLRAPIRVTFGTALRLCREKRGFTLRDVAENINVPIADVALWEDDKGFPAHIKCVRLIGMMPQLRHYKLLIPKLLQDKPDEEERAEARPQPITPAPTPTGPPKDFKEALIQLRRSSKTLTWMKIGDKAGLSGGAIASFVSGRADAMSPNTYNALIAAFPQLKDAPPPPFAYGRGKWTTEQAIAGGLIGARAEAEETPAPKDADLPVTGGSFTIPSITEPVGPPRSMEQLARDYAEAATKLAVATRHAEATWEAALTADEEKKTAQQAAQLALEALQRAVGLIK